ncbi:MAG: ArsC/Spx/MgsR family protein [Microcystaceae cyanobacterium]
MTKVTFYEKPGCINNTKQKKLLLMAGHQLEVYNLLTTPWTLKTLRPFFGSRPVHEWFNRTAPRVKSGEIDPLQLDEETALQLMIEDPILIRRPLIKVDEEYRQGFDSESIDQWIGLSPSTSLTEDVETCPSQGKS